MHNAPQQQTWSSNQHTFVSYSRKLAKLAGVTLAMRLALRILRPLTLTLTVSLSLSLPLSLCLFLSLSLSHLSLSLISLSSLSHISLISPSSLSHLPHLSLISFSSLSHLSLLSLSLSLSLSPLCLSCFRLSSLSSFSGGSGQKRAPCFFLPRCPPLSHSGALAFAPPPLASSVATLSLAFSPHPARCR